MFDSTSHKKNLKKSKQCFRCVPMSLQLMFRHTIFFFESSSRYKNDCTISAQNNQKIREKEKDIRGGERERNPIGRRRGREDSSLTIQSSSSIYTFSLSIPSLAITHLPTSIYSLSPFPHSSIPLAKTILKPEFLKIITGDTKSKLFG